jgi:hypothetical protein
MKYRFSGVGRFAAGLILGLLLGALAAGIVHDLLILRSSANVALPTRVAMRVAAVAAW